MKAKTITLIAVPTAVVVIGAIAAFALLRPKPSTVIPTTARISSIRDDDRLTVLTSTVDILTDIVVYDAGSDEPARFMQILPFEVDIGISLGDVSPSVSEEGVTTVTYPPPRVLGSRDISEQSLDLYDQNTGRLNPIANGVRRFANEYARYYVAASGGLREAMGYLPVALQPWLGQDREVSLVASEADNEAEPHAAMMAIEFRDFPISFYGPEEHLSEWQWSEDYLYPYLETVDSTGSGRIEVNVFPIDEATRSVPDVMLRQVGQVFVPKPPSPSDGVSETGTVVVGTRTSTPYVTVFLSDGYAELNAFLVEGGILYEVRFEAPDEAGLAANLDKILWLLTSMVSRSTPSANRLVGGLTPDRWGRWDSDGRRWALNDVYQHAYLKRLYHLGQGTPDSDDRFSDLHMGPPDRDHRQGHPASLVLQEFQEIRQHGASYERPIGWFYEYDNRGLVGRSAYRVLFFYDNGRLEYYEGLRADRRQEESWQPLRSTGFRRDHYAEWSPNEPLVRAVDALGIPEDTAIAGFLLSPHFRQLHSVMVDAN